MNNNEEEVDRLIDILCNGNPDIYICPHCKGNIHLKPLAISKGMRSFNMVLCPICDCYLIDPRE